MIYENRKRLSKEKASFCISSPPFWQYDVINIVSLLEQRRNLLVGKAGYAAAYARYEEC